MPDGPVRARLTMTVHPDDGPGFESAWRAVADLARRQPACLRQSLAKSGTDEITYVIDSDWADLSAFRAFEHSEEQDAAVKPLRALRRTTQMQLLTLVDHVETWSS
jgi:heme-degrading monooxygenase HmoA